MAKDGKEIWFKKHKKLAALAVIIVIIVIAAAAGGSPGKQAASSDSATKTSAKKVQLAKIGQPADDGKFEFTVTSIKCGEPSVSSDDGYLTKTAQGQYCLLNVDVKNIGNEAQTLDSTSQYLYNSANQKYSSDSDATIYENPSNGTFLNTINPGNTVSGTIVFDLPKDQTPVTAELHDSAFSGGVKVNLQ